MESAQTHYVYACTSPTLARGNRNDQMNIIYRCTNLDDGFPVLLVGRFHLCDQQVLQELMTSNIYFNFLTDSTKRLDFRTIVFPMFIFVLHVRVYVIIFVKCLGLASSRQTDNYKTEGQKKIEKIEKKKQLPDFL